jgi:hypothetical protein
MPQIPTPRYDRLDRLDFRINQYGDLIRFKNSIGSASIRFAATVVVDNRHLFCGALAIPNTDLQRVASIALLLECLNGRYSHQVDAFLLRQDDIVTTAIDGDTGFDANETATTGLVLVLHNLQTTHHTPSMEMHGMVPQFVYEVTLLVDEVTRQHELAHPVGVAAESTKTAGRARGL